jgi:hypothetical protein
MDWKKDPAYYGKILTGRYSRPLQERVAEYISGNRAFEDTGNPAICYIAAWHEKDRIIWYWNQIEEYIRNHSEADFSHGLCPPCLEKLYPEYIKEKSKLTSD